MSDGQGKKGDGGPESLGSAVGAIGLLTAVFFINFIARVIFSPLMPAMQADLKISHSQAGSLFLFISLGYCLTLILSGLITSRITHRWAIIVSALSVGLVLLATGATTGIWGLRLGLLLVGASGGLYLPSAIATITTMLNPRDWGKGLGVHELAPNLAFAGAPLLAGLLFNWMGWREILVTLGVAGLLLAGLFAKMGRGGRFKGQTPDHQAMAGLLSSRPFWIMAILFSLGAGASLGVFAMLPLYLVSDHGHTTQSANFLVGLTRVSGLFMGFVGGWWADRLGARRALMYIMGCTGALTLVLGLSSGPWLMVLVFLQPAVAVCFFAPAFSAISQIFQPRLRNLAVSLIVSVGIVIGGGLLPAITGHLAEAGYFGMGFSLCGVLVLAALLPLAFLRIAPDAADGPPA